MATEDFPRYFYLPHRDIPPASSDMGFCVENPIGADVDPKKYSASVPKELTTPDMGTDFISRSCVIMLQGLPTGLDVNVASSDVVP